MCAIKGKTTIYHHRSREYHFSVESKTAIAKEYIKTLNEITMYEHEKNLLTSNIYGDEHAQEEDPFPALDNFQALVQSEIVSLRHIFLLNRVYI